MMNLTIGNILKNERGIIGYNWSDDGQNKELFIITQSIIDNNKLGNNVNYDYWCNFSTKELSTLFSRLEIKILQNN